MAFTCSREQEQLHHISSTASSMHQASSPPSFSSEVLRFAGAIGELSTVEEILDELDVITNKYARIHVLGAALLPVRWGDFRSLEKGKTVFLHRSAPAGWFEEYRELCQRSVAPGFVMAHLALSPFSMSESLQALEPIGIDRWPHELALKFGIRDGLTCPVGGRWIFAFWSKTVISKNELCALRPTMFIGASFAVFRLQQLNAPQLKRIGRPTLLTPRELSVLRLLSFGQRLKDAAIHLALSEETIRSHLKKAQAKLGVNSRTHAVAQAIRFKLIP